MKAYNLEVTGSLRVTGSILNADGTSFLTGSNAGASASFSTRTTTLETSGSITESSASYSTRVTLLEGSGSITESSASFSTRVTTAEATGMPSTPHIKHVIGILIPVPGSVILSNRKESTVI